MRVGSSGAGPSLAPKFDVTVYLVLDDFGKWWRLPRSYVVRRDAAIM